MSMHIFRGSRVTKTCSNIQPNETMFHFNARFSCYGWNLILQVDGPRKVAEAGGDVDQAKSGFDER